MKAKRTKDYDERPHQALGYSVPSAVYRSVACAGRRCSGIFIVTGTATLRPATSEDVDRLVAWHADPEVARYWDNESFTHAEMEKRLARARVEPWIVEADGESVGYLQVHDAGLDMFLVPSARGRGLGPDAARAMARHLLEERGYERVTVEAYLWNQRAVHGWRSAGFVEVSRHQPDDEHTAEWLLMEYRR